MSPWTDGLHIALMEGSVPLLVERLCVLPLWLYVGRRGRGTGQEHGDHHICPHESRNIVEKLKYIRLFYRLTWHRLAQLISPNAFRICSIGF